MKTTTPLKFTKFTLSWSIGIYAATCFVTAQETPETGTEEVPIATIVLPEVTEEATAAENETGEEVFLMGDFEVSAEQDRGYYSAHSLAATRTNALIKDTPVNITVVNKELMQDLNIVEVNDIAKVIASAGKDSQGSNKAIRFRGFRTNFQLFEFMPRQSPQNYYNIERADIIRGSNSLIYGQSAPGGKVNFNAKKASFGKDSLKLEGAFDNKSLNRYMLDANKVVNDDFAVRVMAIDEEREYAKRHRRSKTTGTTLEATYRPTRMTEMRLHYERSNTNNNSVPGTYKDGTSTAGLTGIPDGLPATPEILKYLSPELRNYIYDYNDGTFQYTSDPTVSVNYPIWWYVGNDRNNSFKNWVTATTISNWENDPANVNPNPPAWTFLSPIININNDQDLSNFYSGITSENSGSISYSNADGIGKNEFTIADISHRVSEDLQLKLSIMHESVKNDGRRPEGGDKLQASIPYGPVENSEANEVGGIGATPNERLFVAPYWVKTIGSDTTTAIRSTLSWEFETPSWKIFPDTSQQLLVGFDYDRRSNNVANLQMYYADADPVNLGEQTLFEDWRPRYSWADRGVDYYPLSYTGTNPYDFVSSSYINLEPGVTPDGYTDNAPLALRERSLRLGTTEVYAAWLALQGKYFNERLHTLTGLRYDNLFVESEYSAYSQEAPDYQNDGRSYYYVNPQKRYHKLSPSLGALYWLNSNFALFGNYSKSIESPTGWELQPDGKDIPPQTGKGYEYGMKFELLDGKITGQALAFHVTKKNDSTKYDGPILKAWATEYAPHLLTTVPTGDFDDLGNQELEIKLNSAGNYIADTIVDSKGFETDLYYNPDNKMSFFLGYAYLDAEIQNSPKLDGATEGIVDGDPYPGFAHHNAVFTARYTFREGLLKGCYAGLSERFTSKSFLGIFYEDVGWADGKNPFDNSIDYYDGLPDVIAVTEYDEALSRANDLNGNGEVDRTELVAKTDTNGDVIKRDPKRHEVWLSDNFNTTIFAGWRGKFFGKGQSAPIVNIQFTIDNLFDVVDLVARGRNAAFTESRTYGIRASITF